MSWTESHRCLFFRGISERPPTRENIEECAEEIKETLNAALKRFQKKYTVSDVIHKIHKYYDLSQVDASDKDTLGENAAGKGAANERNFKKKHDEDVPIEEELSDRAGRARRRRRSDNEEEALKTESESATQSSREDQKSIETTGKPSSNSPGTSEVKEEGVQTENDGENVENESEEGDSAVEIQDSAREESDIESGSDGVISTPEPTDEANENESVRSRRVSRAARPSMSRSSLSPRRARSQNSLRASKQNVKPVTKTLPRAATPKVAPNKVSKSAGKPVKKSDSLKRSRSHEPKSEISDSEIDSPPFKKTQPSRSKPAPQSSGQSSASSTNKPSRKKTDPDPKSSASSTARRADAKNSRKPASKNASAKPTSTKQKSSSRRAR